MSTRFDWQIDEDEETPSEHQRRWRLSSLGSIAIVIAIALTLGAIWQVGRQSAKRSEQILIGQVQELLDRQQQALIAGDGDLFFSFFTPDPTWRMTQLRPELLASYRAGLTVTRASTSGEEVWANVTWTENGHELQRILFLNRDGGRLLLAPTGSDYWQKSLRESYRWGDLRYNEIDAEWAPAIASYVAQTIAELCVPNCTTDWSPLTIQIATDYRRSMKPKELRFPSPRLFALNEAGEPAEAYWHYLHASLNDQLTPATIRFAIPPPRSGLCCGSLDFSAAAAEFMAQNPDIKIELVALDALPDDLTTLATDFDGAAITPTADMVAAGSVFDLTDFARGDPDFVVDDFYGHIWQGAQWRERIWFMPLTAEFNLLYYDRLAYTIAGVPEPNLFWQWADIGLTGSVVLAEQPEHSTLTWPFLDISQDTLFAYAYSLADSCPESAVSTCLSPLQPYHIVRALDWYKSLVLQGQTPDVTRLSPEEREWTMNNYQSARRHALFWVDEPIMFEYFQLLDPVGVVPFPGVDGLEGVTPLWVNGAFISAQSERPLATWRWLKFLSYQPPVKSYRLVPARTSVAAETNYWRNLPRPIVDAMRTAFTFARPVALPERRYFSWAQLADVISGAQTPQEAAQQTPQIEWFGQK